MQNNQDLFQLIKSLSGNEKRYFKLFSSMQSGDKSYLKIFDVMDQMREFDEQEFKRLLRKNAMSGQASRIKNYLYRAILKSMRSYQSDKSVARKLADMRDDIGFLYQKGLYSQCWKLLKKAKEIAKKAEFRNIMLGLIQWEKRLWWIMSFEEKSLDDVRLAHMEIGEELNAYGVDNDYWYLSAQFFYHYQKLGPTRSQKQLALFDELADSPLMANEELATTFEAKKDLYYTQSLYQFLKGNYGGSYEYTSKNLRLFESRPGFLKDRAYTYLSALHNHLTICRYLGKYDEMVEKIDIINEVSIDTETFRIRKYLYYYFHSLFACDRTSQINRGIELIGEMENKLLPHVGKISKYYLIEIYYTCARLYFQNAQFDKALAWVNRVINEDWKGIRNDIVGFSRILNLIIHFELGNRMHLDYAVISTYRFLLKNKRLFQVETMILDYIRKYLPKVTVDQQLMDSFRELRSRLLPLKADEYEAKAFDLFDLIDWLDHKIKDREQG